MLARLTLGLLAVIACSPPAAASARACAHDDALARVAATLSLERTRPSPQRLLRTLRAEGSDRVAAHLLWLDGDEPVRRAAWLRRLRARSDTPLVCGEAQSADRLVLVAATRAGALTPAGDSSPRLVAWLAPGFRDPYLVFRAADGALSRRGLAASDLGRGFSPPSELRRPVTVQLVATGSSGPRPVAERRLEPVSPRTGELPSTQLELGGSVSQAVASLRELRGVSPLRPNRLLARVARSYAQRVCRAGRIVHQLSEGGDPSERLRRSGIQARVVGEAVARAASVPEALTALAESPSHLMAIVDRRFTDAGYGVATDARGRRCVVVLLAAWPRAVPVSVAARRTRPGAGRGRRIR